jgi:RNA polymerase sigma-70 factor (ECF subfamily)
MVLNGDEKELIEACRRGDPEAFAVLFHEHSDKVYSIALRYSGDETVAMDIAQDTFLKLLSHLGQFRSDSRFDTWLYRLVVNSCLDYQRRKRKTIPVLDGILDAVHAVHDTVLHQLLRQERRDAVQDVVAKLPPDHRIVVILRYMEELSYEQIAEVLGCSIGTISSRLNRAHKLLERRLSHLRLGNGGGRG